LGAGRSGRRRQDTLDDQYTPVRSDRPPAPKQDVDCLGVSPIVNNRFQDIGIAATGDGFKEAAADYLASIGDTGFTQKVRGTSDDRW
jgi:hypothetical protein